MATRGITIPRPRLAIWKIAVDRRRLVYAAALACIPLAFAVYWPFIGTFFVSDDFVVLRAVRGYSFLEIVTRAFGFPKAGPLDPATGSWRPLTDLYFYAMSPAGLHAQPYHVVNIALHGLVGALATLLIWRLSGSARAAVATSLLFIVVPTYTFLVTWNVEVSELTEAACILAALLVYHEYLTSAMRKPVLLAAVLLLTVLAVLSKESSVLLLLLLPGLAWLTSLARTCRRREILSSLVPSMALLLSYVGITQLRQMELHDASHGTSLHTARSFWDYLRWMMFPYRFGDLMALRSAAAGAFLALGIATIATRRYVFGALFVWSVAALAFYSQQEVLELRYTYLATLGLIGFIVCGTNAALTLLSPRWEHFLAVPLGLLMAIIIAASAVQTRDQQAFITSQAKAYRTALDGVRNLCGLIPAGSYVYVVNGPVFDSYGLNMPAAVNLYYDHINAAAVLELPPLAAFITNKCVIQYDWQTGRYIRVD